MMMSPPTSMTSASGYSTCNAAAFPTARIRSLSTATAPSSMTLRSGSSVKTVPPPMICMFDKAESSSVIALFHEREKTKRNSKSASRRIQNLRDQPRLSASHFLKETSGFAFSTSDAWTHARRAVAHGQFESSDSRQPVSIGRETENRAQLQPPPCVNVRQVQPLVGAVDLQGDAPLRSLGHDAVEVHRVRLPGVDQASGGVAEDMHAGDDRGRPRSSPSSCRRSCLNPLWTDATTTSRASSRSSG